MIDVGFYLGERLLAEGKWTYLPVPGMGLRLELPGGALVCTVVGVEGTSVAEHGSRPSGPVPKVLARGVRVLVEARVDVPDDLRELG